MNIVLNKKQINKNLLTNALSQAVGIGFPIIIQYYIIRHLNIEDIGYWNIILSAQGIVLLFNSYFNVYLINVFAKTNTEQEISQYISNTIVLMYVILILPFLVFIAYMLYNYPHLYKYFLISSISILTTPLSLEFYFQATLKNEYILYRRLSVRILFIIGLLVLVKNESDFIIYAIITALSLSLEHLLNFSILSHYFNIQFVNRNLINNIFKNTTGYLPFNLSYNLLPNISIIIGASYWGVYAIAIFSILFKLINLATTIISSTVMVLFPVKISMNNNNTQKEFSDLRYLKNTVIASIVIITGLIISRKLIFALFLNSYSILNLELEFSTLCFYILLHSVYNYFVFNYYLIENRSWYITFLNLIIISIFFLEVALSKWYNLKISFSFAIILPTLLATSYLFFRTYKKILQ